MGLEAGDTDSLTGRIARFYLNGTSKWEIEFSRAVEVPPPVPDEDP